MMCVLNCFFFVQFEGFFNQTYVFVVKCGVTFFQDLIWCHIFLELAMYMFDLVPFWGGLDSASHMLMSHVFCV